MGTFDEVVGGDLAAITRRLNERFGTAFTEFDPTPENVERCAREIDQDWSRRHRDGERLQRIAPRPSGVREGLEAVMTRRFDAEAPTELRRLAERLYVRFTDGIAR